MVTTALDLAQEVRRLHAGGLGPEAVAERIAATLTPPERAKLFKACLRAYCREVLTGTTARPEAGPAGASQAPETHPWRQYPNRAPDLGRQQLDVQVDEEGVRGVISFRCSCCREPFPDVDGMLDHRARPGPCYSPTAEMLQGG